MFINVSALALTGLLSVILLRSRAVAAAVPVVFLFGFYTASTGAAPTIRQMIVSLAHALNSLG